MPQKCWILFTASARNQRWCCHTADLASLSLESLLLGLLDLQTPCFLPFWGLHPISITEAKLRRVWHLLSLQSSLWSTAVSAFIVSYFLSNLGVNTQKAILFSCFLPNRGQSSQFTFQNRTKINYDARWNCMFTCNDGFKITWFRLWH